VLADEPTSALDGENGRTIMRLLADAARERGQAVLVVTHDPRIVPVADRVIHIEDGLLVDNPPGEVLRLPKAARFGPLAALTSDS
jgi:putative ABC transport system ATP-binding protein